MFISLSCAGVLLLSLFSLSLRCGFTSSWLLLRVAMSLAGGLPLPVHGAEVDRGSWTVKFFLGERKKERNPLEEGLWRPSKRRALSIPIARG